MVKTTGVEITLDRPRSLRFTINNLAWFEERAGKGLLETLKEIEVKGPLFRELRLMTCAALRHENKEMTVEQAGDIMEASPKSLFELAEALSDAATRALGTEDEIERMAKERKLQAGIVETEGPEGAEGQKGGPESPPPDK